MDIAYEDSGTPHRPSHRGPNGDGIVGLHSMNTSHQSVDGPGTKVGDILMRAQRFSEERAAEAERQAKDVLQAARSEATAIVEAANREAARIASAVPPAVSIEAVEVLSGAVDEFAAANRSLVDEITQLRKSLAAPEPETNPWSDLSLPTRHR